MGTEPRVLRALCRARLRALAGALRGADRATRRRTVIISAVFLAIWLGMFWGAEQGQAYLLRQAGGLSGALPRLTGALFAALGLMLALSQLLLSTSLLFYGETLESLRVLPVPAAPLFLVRQLEAALLGGWAFVIFAWPIAATLPAGPAGGVPRLGGLLALALFATAVSAAAGLGALLAGRFLPRLSGRGRWLLAGATALGLFLALKLGLGAALRPDLPAPWLDHPALPATWLAEALRAPDLAAQVPWLGALAAAALLGYAILLAAAARLYEPALMDFTPRAAGLHPATRALAGAWAALWTRQGGAGAALCRKDALVFLRDPRQYAQFLLLLALLLLYGLGLDHTDRVTAEYPLWRAKLLMTSQTALALVAAILSTRFVFPQLPLEGPALPLLELSPLGRGGLYRQKFRSAAAAELVFILPASLVTAVIVDLEPAPAIYALAVLLPAALAFAAISTGLSAALPAFDESDPQRVVNGLGGTLNFFVHLGVVLWSALFLSGLYLHDLGIIGPLMLVAGAALHGAVLLPAAFIVLRWGAATFEGREFGPGI